MRSHDAQALLAAQRFDAAYYLAGYAVECALKACIARATAQYDFPDKNVVEKSWKHSPQHLIGVAGLQQILDAAIAVDLEFADNWATVAQWHENFRYYEGVTAQEAQDMVQAIGDPLHGVLGWVQQHW